MDFFDQPPYTNDVDEYTRLADFYGSGRPLTFTEWGGGIGLWRGEPNLQRMVDRLMELSESGKLAGSAFWSWQDIPQFSRIDAEMRDGILESGVVAEDRRPRPMAYMQLARLFQGVHQVEMSASASPTLVPLKWS